MLGLLLCGTSVKEISECLSENREYTDIVEIDAKVITKENREEFISFASSVKIPKVLRLTGTEEMESLQQLLEACRFDFVSSSNHHLCTRLSKTLKKTSVIRISPSEKMQNLYKTLKKASENSCIPAVNMCFDSEETLVSYFSFLNNISAFGKKIIYFSGDYCTPAAILYRKADSMYLCCEKPENLRILKTVYRADRINSETTVYATVGNPANDALSQIMNSAFPKVGMNSVFIPFMTNTLKAFFRISDILDISGFSITKPFNREIIPYLGKISREVTQTGAANLAVRENRYLKGMNTDYYGILNLLEKELDSGKIKNAVVFGCGVAGHSAVWALRYRHVNVTILNRTADKARKLAAQTMSEWDSLENASKYTGKADLIIQATSSVEDYAPDFKFTGKELVCDLVYNANSSAFMSGAEKAGCRIISGKSCLISQGKLQFEKLTGFYYPE
ncbi:MAG: hypothetical protein K5634_05795 [Sphaerochaetaceae bacterium]|nr:hypothetical protein [Sphaerochaetaceae bacterium]